MNTIAGIIEPLALGFSTGTWCVMYCAPVLLPFLCGREGLSHRKNLSLVGLFLSGRLLAYVAVGLLLGLAGFLVSEFFDPVLARRLSAVAYIFCGLVLLASGFGKRLCGLADHGGRTGCRGKRFLPFATGDRMTALLSGLCVGLHICPPFWTAAVRSVATGSPAAGSLYFLLFYIGTLPFFLPLLGIPFFSPRVPAFRRIARVTQVLVGGYFLVCAGIIPFAFAR
jgi:sulfite exporter TauE/SafE